MKKLQANEFRIGNLVKYEGNVYAIDSISKEFPTLNTMEFGVGVVDWDNIEPIPLTEEWLVKFGFEPLPFANILNSYNKSIGRNRILSVTNCGTPNEMIWICELNATDSEKIDDLVCIRNYDYDKYTHVHQLQNLYFTLTNEELTLQP